MLDVVSAVLTERGPTQELIEVISVFILALAAALVGLAVVVYAVDWVTDSYQRFSRFFLGAGGTLVIVYILARIFGW